MEVLRPGIDAVGERRALQQLVLEAPFMIENREASDAKTDAADLYLAIRPRVSQFSPFVEIKQSLPSRVADISPFVDQLMQFLKPLIDKFHNEDGSDADIEMAVREAIANAVVHGNHENPQKRVHVNCRCSMDGEVLITVRDEGQGFDSRSVPDPTDPSNLLLTHGRGLWLMQAFMDEVGFQENGTVVRMRKSLRRPIKQE